MEGEEEFIVFAIGEGLTGGAAGIFGEKEWINGKVATAGGGHSGEIGAESVAQIHHGVEFEVFGEPAGFGEAWDKIEMMARDGSAEATGDIKEIAGATAGAKDTAGAFDGAGQGDIDEKRAWGTSGFASDDGNVEACGNFLEACVNIFEAVKLCGGGSGDGDECVLGESAHGGEVADGSGEGFAADSAGDFCGSEVDAFDEGVGFEQAPQGCARVTDDRAVVAWADADGGRSGKIFGEFCDDGVFAEIGKFQEEGRLWSAWK